MLIFFHVTDDAPLDGMQAGLYYPNETPKRSLAPVAASIAEAEHGRIDGLDTAAVRSVASEK